MNCWGRDDEIQYPFSSPTFLFDIFQLLKVESERSNYASS
jgi:hypothetical protein